MVDIGKLHLFLNNGGEFVLEAGEESGIRQQQLNSAFEALETQQKRIVIDFESNGKAGRNVFLTEQIAFYRAEYAKEQIGFEEFQNKVAYRLQEVEFNATVTGIEISEFDYMRFFHDPNQWERVVTRFMGRKLTRRKGLETGEFELITDKGVY